MPVCPECSFWTPDFHQGEVDHNGTYAISLSITPHVFLVGSVTVVGKLGRKNVAKSG